ncbi:MAG TPA: heme exporter protein CcmB [Actinomycetota bacterium]|nr:heme exporter protein CcmB [Actinomycetota bacterium]
MAATAAEVGIRERAEAGFWTKVLVLARKDLVIEARARETLPPMLAFAFTVTLLLAFALPAGARIASAVRVPFGAVPVADVLSGYLWVTILFAGLIGFARTFEVERSGGALDPLLLAPLDRSGLFAAKAAANLVYLLALELFLLPVFSIVFSANLGARWIVLMIVIVLADIGCVAVGTLFAALAAQTRSRELMLPVLALPILVPAFIAAVELTADVLTGAPLSDVAARGWFGILVAYDIVFTVVAALAFEFALDQG